MSTEFFPPADRTAQWFEDDFGGARMNVNVGCLHTTEGTSWPGYDGGAVAPNLPAKPVMSGRHLQWRQHFRLNTSSSALVNNAGGVATNTLNVVQVELVGTCNPANREHFDKGRAGVDYIYKTTQKAVREYRQNNGLPVGHGVIGPRVWHLLLDQAAAQVA
jgi:hypothetical protein